MNSADEPGGIVSPSFLMNSSLIPKSVSAPDSAPVPAPARAPSAVPTAANSFSPTDYIKVVSDGGATNATLPVVITLELEAT